MPNLKTYSLSQICGLFDEAIRAIPGYDKYDPTYEPKALINYDKTKDNYALYINPCMLHKKGERNKSQKIINLIKEKTGKNPRKDCVACSLIVTLPRDYEGDPRIFFEASVNAICITCGIKKEDILYAVCHKDESQDHLHLAFLPMSYVRDYDAKLEAYNKQRDEAKANGTKVPARPTILKGEVCRKIEDDEKPISTNCGRFGKGFLHNLNKNLEDRMREQGVEVRIANEAGSKFDPQRLNHQQREESLKLFEENEKLKKEIETAKLEKAQAETKVSAIKSELETTTKQLESTQEELTIAINEKEIAETKVSACEEKVAKATMELEELQDVLEEKEIELQDKVAQIDSLKDIINELKVELANLVKEVVMFVPNVIKSFIKGWKDAKTNVQKEEIDNQARAKALAGANQMTEHLRVLGSKAEALLVEEEIVNGVKMSTFNQTDQKLGFAKNQILKSATLCGKAEVFADRRVMALALQDWFDKDKHKARISNMSELDASLYMKFPNRASRAVEYALEKMEEKEMDIELD